MSVTVELRGSNRYLLADLHLAQASRNESGRWEIQMQRALKNETDEPKKKAVDPTRRVISVTERTTVTTRRYGAAAGVTNASEARQRMIAERTRRILDDE